ncbi:hypothetical protein RHGRI_023802 [Rhododendron griersonianum]|uniref:GRF-type domain-containing protein n=1 Tax=Rhododendron griersonianum TaxID=479676 RepID=A0AAV6J4S7_9ERIC|nr:hypothetical protein RHGRI_023802 [Rhododendron griersonianum]
MSSSSSYYRAESETKKGVTNTPKLLYKPRDCYCGLRAEIKVVEKSEKSKGELYFICPKERAARCGFFDWCLPVEWTSSGKIGGWGSTEHTNVCASNVCATKVIDDVVVLEKELMLIRPQLEYSKMVTKILAICLVLAMGVIRHPECIKFREHPLPLEEEMRILFGSNTATGEHMHTPSAGSVPAAPKERTINLEVDDIDALLDNDAEVQELVHPLEDDVSKKRRVDGSATKKGKGRKGTMGSRLEACMQQICDSTDSASSPSSVHRAAPDIPTIKECSEKLILLPEFDTDPTLWAKAHNLFRDARTRTLFMTCPDEIRMYHFITQELQRVEAAELQKMGGGNWFNNR